MKDTEYHSIIELLYTGGGWLPANQNAMELSEQAGMGEVFTFKEITGRDLNFHRCYFSLLSYIYGKLPANFKLKVPKDKFYFWLKHLKGQYDVLFEFKDGTKLCEYQSVAFGKMSQAEFENYIREQLPYIYESVIRELLPEKADGIIEQIEKEYKKFLSKL